ncbi:MAG: GTP-binding protein [Candidatus Heimdallarchaeota archaeon]|nr:GTP-binding protein [Candidatus Heimdallarchaeota archaeon]
MLSGVPKKSVYKIVLLGDGAVGKTSIRQQYLGKGFKDGYSMTIGADFCVKRVEFDDLVVTFQIWDLAGQQRFDVVREVYYRGSSGALLVFDVSTPGSFENLPSWLNELTKNNYNRIVPIVLIGNKTDLRGTTPCLPAEAGQQYANSLTEWTGFEVPYIETSAKTGENIDKAFRLLSQQIEHFLDKYQLRE